MSWETAKLGDVTEVSRGTTITKKQTVHGDIPVIGGGMKPTYFHNEFNRDAGVITISGSGASAGFVNYWEEPIFASDCSTVQPFDKSYDKKFLYFFLLSQQQFIYENFRSGAAQPHVYAKDIATLDIPKIDLTVQKKIVEKLDAAFADIDKTINATEKNIENAEAFYRSNLEYKFNSINAEDEEIGNILKLEYGKGLPKEDRNDDGVYPAYGANGIKYKTNNFLYENPSIIVGRKGSAGEITLTEPKFWALDVTYYVTFDEERYSLDFLYYLLKKLDLPSLATGVKPGINRNNVYSVSVKVPTLSSQQRISAVLKETDTRYNKLLSIYQQKLSEYINLKSAILNQAFLGELTKDVA